MQNVLIPKRLFNHEFISGVGHKHLGSKKTCWRGKRYILNLDYILAIFEATFRVVLTPNFSEQVLYLKFQSDVGAFGKSDTKKRKNI